MVRKMNDTRIKPFSNILNDGVFSSVCLQEPDDTIDDHDVESPSDQADPEDTVSYHKSLNYIAYDMHIHHLHWKNPCKFITSVLYVFSRKLLVLLGFWGGKRSRT